MINANAPKLKSAQISYRTYSQKVGWNKWVDDGEYSGTQGRSLRVEGIQIRVNETRYEGGVKYKSYNAKTGWEPEYLFEGSTSGKLGTATRLEAIKIILYDKLSTKADIYYRTYAQKFGWLGWAKNGQISGTIGYNYRLEGIQIKVVDKGEKFNVGTKPTYRRKGK